MVGQKEARLVRLKSGLALQPTQPVINISPNLILGNSITLLDFAFQLITTAVDRSEVVVSELTPLLFYPTGQLFPASLNTIPIHCSSPLRCEAPVLGENRGF